jgi:MFS family permease
MPTASSPGAESAPSRPRHRPEADRPRRLSAVIPDRGSRRHHGLGFWAVALTFLTLAAFTTVPSPLYGLYQARDGFSTFLITVIFAAYAVGVIVALFFAGHVSDWLGRRRALVPAVLTSLLSAVVFLLWRDLPGLLVGRVLSGLSVGIVTATATVYLAELHVGERPGASPKRAQVLATTANLGGLGLGPIVAGVLAETVSTPLTVPFVLFGALLAIAAIAVALAPETVTPPETRPAYRPQRVALPAEARGRFFGAGRRRLRLLRGLRPVHLAGAFVPGRDASSNPTRWPACPPSPPSPPPSSHSSPPAVAFCAAAVAIAKQSASAIGCAGLSAATARIRATPVSSSSPSSRRRLSTISASWPRTAFAAGTRSRRG